MTTPTLDDIHAFIGTLEPLADLPRMGKDTPAPPGVPPELHQMVLQLQPGAGPSNEAGILKQQAEMGQRLGQDQGLEQGRAAAIAMMLEDAPPEMREQRRDQLTKLAKVDPNKFAALAQGALQGTPMPPADTQWQAFQEEFGRQAEHSERLVPFIGQVADAVEAKKLYDASKNVEAGQASDEDYVTVIKYAQQAKEDEGRRRIGTTVADILAQLPGFALEFGATGGAYMLGKEMVAKTIGKALAKTTAKIAEGGAVRKIAANLFKKTVMSAGGAAVQSIPAQGIRMAAGSIRNVTPTIATGSDETKPADVGPNPEFAPIGAPRLTVAPGDNVPTAVGKAIADSYVEVFSERGGEALKMLPKWKRGAALVAKIKDKLGIHEGGAFNKALDQAGFHGVTGEMFEERLGEVMHAAYDKKQRDELLSRTPQQWLEQLGAEAIGFSAPGAITAGEQVGEEVRRRLYMRKRFSKKYLLSSPGARFVIAADEMVARAIAAKEKPSRNDFKTLVPADERWTLPERIEFAEHLRVQLGQLVRGVWNKDRVLQEALKAESAGESEETTEGDDDLDDTTTDTPPPEPAPAPEPPPPGTNAPQWLKNHPKLLSEWLSGKLSDVQVVDSLLAPYGGVPLTRGEQGQPGAIAEIPELGKSADYSGQSHSDAIQQIRESALNDLQKARSSPASDSRPPEEILARHFTQRLADSATRYETILDARKEAAAILGKRSIEAGTPDAKLVDEAVEVGVTKAARNMVEAGRLSNESPVDTFDKLLDLYNRQPNLSVRTSTSRLEQAYSTPAPIAFAMSHLAGVNANTMVYEPTAGNGMLLIGAKPSLTFANEINKQRYESLQRFLGNATNEDAIQYAPPTPVDVVLMNPPFGKVTGRTWNLGDFKTSLVDHAIAWKALQSMKPTGRAAMLLAGPNTQAIKAGERERREFYKSGPRIDFYYNLHQKYNVVGHYTLSGDMYSKQGASYPIDLIVVDGLRKGDFDKENLPQITAPQLVESYAQLRQIIEKNVEGRRQPLDVPQPGGGASSENSPNAGPTDTGGTRTDGGTDQSQPEPNGGPADAGAGGDGGEPSRQPAPKTTGNQNAGGSTQGGGRTDGEGADGGGLPNEPGAGPDGPRGVTKPDPFAKLSPEARKRAQELAEKMRKKLAQESAPAKADDTKSFDPELFVLGTQLGEVLVNDGVRDFNEFAAMLGASLGPQIAPYVKRIYAGVRAAVADDVADSMTPDKEVRAVSDEDLNTMLGHTEQPPEESPADKPKTTRDEPENIANATDENGNPHQTKYTPHSTARSADSFIPKNQAEATQRALDRLVLEHSNIDEYVAGKLGFTYTQTIERFLGEQVDGVAMALAQVDRGRGMIIGDQTGVGKGRIMAALIHYARLQGWTPVFVTERPQLYQDMMRDLTGIGQNTAEKRFNPLITNSNATGKNAIELLDGRILKSFNDHNAVLARAIESAAETGVLAANVNGKRHVFDAIFTTYSQLQTTGGTGTSARHPLMTQIAPNAFFIFDEAHNAGGDGGQQQQSPQPNNNAPPSIPRSQFVRELIGQSQGAVFSSATYAKRPNVMDLYATTDMSLAVDSPTQIGPAMEMGGVPLQQVVSEMLAEVGQYIRREKDMSNIKFHVQEIKTDLRRADAISDGARQLMRFDLLVADIVRGLRTAGRAGVGGGRGAAGASRTSFGSMMHNLVSQAILCNKMDAVAEEAQKSVAEGKKPFIVLSNTLESALEDIAETKGANHGEELDASFADVMLMYLERMRRYRERGPGGVVTHHYLTDQQLGPAAVALYNEIKKSINNNPAIRALPLSPIDYLRFKLEKAGIPVGEITGRTMTLTYRDGKPPILDVKASTETGTRGKQAVLDGYNGRGDSRPLIAIIANQSGSTGLSAHASPENGNDLRPREMFIVQPDPNIDTFMQIIGRVNRTGQIHPPTYKYLITDMPIELRPAAVMMKKMASLNANTSSSREGASTFKAPDFINQVGDEIVAQIMTERPDLHDALGRPLEKQREQGGTFKPLEAARLVTGKAMLLSVEEQRELYDEIESRYHARIDQLESMGMNPLRARELDLDAKTIETRPLFSARSESDSPFAAGADLETIDAKKQGKPYTSQEVRDMVAERTPLSNNLDKRQSATNKTLPGGFGVPFTKEPLFASAQQAEVVARTNEWVGKQLAELEETLKQRGRTQEDIDFILKKRYDALMFPLEVLRHFMQHYNVGKPALVTESRSGEQYYGIIVELKRVGSSLNPAATGAWRVKVAVADSAREIEFSVNQWNTGQIRLDPIKPDLLKIATGSDDIYGAFDASRRQTREKRYVVTGNLLAGFARVPSGQITMFTRSDGSRDRGILLPKSFKPGDVKAAPSAPLDNFGSVKAYLKSSDKNWVATGDDMLTVKYSKLTDSFVFECPASKKKGGRYALDKDILAAMQPERRDGFTTVGDVARASLSEPAAERVLKVIFDRGQAVFTKTTEETSPPKDDGGGGSSKTFVSENEYDDEAEREYGFVASDQADGEPLDESLEYGGNTTYIPTSNTDLRPQRMGIVARALAWILNRKDELSNNEIIAQMEREFGVPIRTGKVPGKAAGIYKTHAEVVRFKSKYGGDLGIGAHEVAHHLDFTTDVTKHLSPRMEFELKRLDYNPKMMRVEEGFAEFIRHFLTQDSADQLAPAFYKYFTEIWLKDHPDIEAKFAKIRSLIDTWRTEGPEHRIKAQISKTGVSAIPPDVPVQQYIKDRISQGWNTLYTALFDKGHAIDLMTREAKRRGYKTTDASAYDLWLSMTQGGPHAAGVAIDKGVFLISENNFRRKITKSIGEILSEIHHNEYDDFVAFMYARHAIESWSKNKNPGITIKDAKLVYAKHQNNRRFVDAADGITEFNNGLITMLEDAGVIDYATAQRVTKAYRTYIPLLRARDRLSARYAGQKLVNVGRTIHGRRGSGLQIIDPIHATMQRAVRFYTRAAQQQVMQAMFDQARGVKGMGHWMEKVPPGVKKITFDAKKIEAQLAAIGVDTTAIDLDQHTFFFWQPTYDPPGGGKPIARLIEDGKPVLVEMDRDLLHAVDGMNYYQLPRFFDLTFGAATRLQKLGLTGLSVAFGARNPVRDYFTYLFQSDQKMGVRKFIGPAAMMAAYVRSEAMHLAGKAGDPLIELFQDMGGELSNAMGQDLRKARAKTNEIMADSAARRTWNIVTHPLDAARKVLSIPESGPRAAEFAARVMADGTTREDIRAGRLPSRKTLVEAHVGGQDVTVNFGRSGWLNQKLNQIIPFWNAPFQGVDKMARTFRDHPVRSMAWTAAIVAATIAYWIRRKDDDDYKQMASWLKYGFFTITNDEGKPIIRLPVPQEWGFAIKATTEMLLNAMHERDPKALSDWLDATANAVLPSLWPALVKPGQEAISNHDYFRDAPIDTDRQLKVKPEDRFDPRTTLLARKAGKALGVSPKRLEHAAEGYTGGLYGGIERQIERFIPGSDPRVEYPGQSAFTLRQDYTRAPSEFYAELTKAEQEYNSAKLKNEVPEKVEQHYKVLKHFSKLANDLHALVPNVSDRDERYKIEKYITGLAMAAMGDKPLARYPNPITTKDVPPEVAEARNAFLVAQADRLDRVRPLRMKDREEFEREKAVALETIRLAGVSPEQVRDAYVQSIIKPKVRGDDGNMKPNGRYIKSPETRAASIRRLMARLRENQQK